MSWGYTAENGPHTWVNNFPIAGGEQQSPVDIIPSTTIFDSKLGDSPISVTYYVEQNMKMENNGLSVKASIKEPSSISGGPLTGTYQLEQFHFHWGSKDEQGSEHTVDGQMYPAELHLVHYNRDKYSSFTDAVDKPDGLAVFGIFMKVGEENPAFAGLTECLNCVKHSSKCDIVKGQFNTKALLPKNMSEYWTYPGSLTTPPCFESVTWIVFKEVMEVSQAQMTALRSLCCGTNDTDHIVDNYRPPCCLGKRQIRASFQ